MWYKSMDMVTFNRHGRGLNETVIAMVTGVQRR